MKKLPASAFIVVVFMAIFSGCKKQSETLQVGSPAEYFPLQTGKIYLYRLDSTIPSPFGASLIVKSYQAQDSVESAFTDNEGRLSYRIFRFTRDTLGIQSWQFSGTYVATSAPQWIEYVDNNLRFLKLHAPVAEGYSWQAHSFIDTKSINSTVTYLDGWQYEYRHLNEPFTLFNTTYDSTVTVFQHDETTPDAPFDPANYYQLNKAYEVYAKDVGMIYKEFLHWTWQVTPPPAKYEDGSYGIKLQLISHN